jgi:hypothetical protein
MQNESIGRDLGLNQLQNDQGLGREQFGNARQIAQEPAAEQSGPAA